MGDDSIGMENVSIDVEDNHQMPVMIRDMTVLIWKMTISIWRMPLR